MLDPMQLRAPKVVSRIYMSPLESNLILIINAHQFLKFSNHHYHPIKNIHDVLQPNVPCNVTIIKCHRWYVAHNLDAS